MINKTIYLVIFPIPTNKQTSVYSYSPPPLVHECRNLPPMDANGLADPYVKLRLYPEPTDVPNIKQKTERQEKTLEPKFEEGFF